MNPKRSMNGRSDDKLLESEDTMQRQSNYPKHNMLLALPNLRNTISITRECKNQNHQDNTNKIQNQIENNLEPDSNHHQSSTKKKGKRSYHHTPNQIQELERVYKESPVLGKKQRLKLGEKLAMDIRKVKFWFQNKRTNLKAQMVRYENKLLRAQNQKLKAENKTLANACKNTKCKTCGLLMKYGEICSEKKCLLDENSRLHDHLDRVSALAKEFFNHPLSDMARPLCIHSQTDSKEQNAFDLNVPADSPIIDQPL